ncbi:2Fe-2S iron-sulfur cluster-binding protein [Rapidithrix thailandica]
MSYLIVKNLKHLVLSFKDKSETLLKKIQEHNIDWMHACGAKGRCTSCRVEVVKGGEVLSELTQSEQRMRDLGRLKAHERLTCQATFREEGEVEVRIPKMCQFKHMEYGEE